MRVSSMCLIVMASLTQAHAEEPANAKPRTDSSCSYTVSEGQTVELPVGASACFRSPPPYTDDYALLHCYPPIQEIELVKRGDPRCGDRYEERQRRK